jgi:hypothetical protein
MPLFLFIFSYFITYTYTFIQSHSYNTVIHRHSLRPLSISHCLYAQWETPPCGAEPRIELGTAFQQADALPTEPRRTITEPGRTMWVTLHHVSNAAPWSHAAPWIRPDLPDSVVRLSFSPFRLIFYFSTCWWEFPTSCDFSTCAWDFLPLQYSEAFSLSILPPLDFLRISWLFLVTFFV